ncbi:DUF2911 domain-containing protein [Spongiivirga sp. MCCC 1A20706]|uniref:DUF2911 domain-containing protein n=1 Tax=Spongiivirga sp. MCCC 1A20706 TaxID=3160963 RepID=UPI0039776D39
MKKMNFKHVSSIALICIALVTSNDLFGQLTVPATSPEAEITQRVGITDITIHYNRPYVRGRKIWGGLVQYGFNNLGFGTATAAPWRAGADYNTTIEFTHDVKLEGNDVKAGKYALFMAPEENGDVMIILSNNTTSWGSYFYDESEDALRFKVKSVDLETSTEMLTYEFNEVDATTATASLKWEKKEIPFKISVAVTDIVLEGIANDLRNPNGFQQSSWDQAANYAFNAERLDLALEWVNKSISGQFFSKETFSNLDLKSRILSKQRKNAEASQLLDKAVSLGTSREVYGVGDRLLREGNTDKALAIMKKNVKNSQGAFPSNFGLARAYSAKKDFKNAIKSLKKAIATAPDNFKPRLQQNLDRLSKGEDINTPAN